MNDEQPNSATPAERPDDICNEDEGEESAIAAALLRARQASAEGWVYSQEDARRAAAKWGDVTSG
jgi:hypothetical protein